MSVARFSFDGLEVGGDRVVVIAEAGVNHDGDVDKALALVDAAADAGADIVKFQTFSAERLVTASAPKAAYQQRDGAKSQLEMLQRLELDRDAHALLIERARRRRIVFLSTPFDVESARMLAALGVGAFKLGSGEVTDTPLLRAIAAMGLPLLLSTGMSTMADVERALAAVDAASSTCPRALLHCVSSYPARLEDVNLRALHTLRARFRVPVGFSDHTEGIDVAVAAVAAGASILEKHFTLDRRADGPDHAFSLEPGELAQLVDRVRAVERMLGDGEKRPTPAEHEIALVARKSLTAARALAAGTTLTPDALAARRPGTGVPPWRAPELTGRVLRRALAAGEQVSIEDVE